MSYADKRRSQADCASSTCGAPGTELKVVFGRLNWVCAEHAKIPDAPSRPKPGDRHFIR